MVLQVTLDGCPLVRVTGLHQYHRVAEHHMGDRAKKVIRLFNLGPLCRRLFAVFVCGTVDGRLLAFRHGGCGRRSV